MIHLNNVRKIIRDSKTNIIGVTENWLSFSDTSRAVYLLAFSRLRQERPNVVNRERSIVLNINKRFRTMVLQVSFCLNWCK